MALKRGVEPGLDTVWNSPLLSRARAAQECFAELPFSLHYQTPSHTDTVLNGVIDLAFLENGAWVIVGLKDDVLSDGQAEPRAARYRSELSVYALALEQLSVYPVQDLVVLFARSATDVHFVWNDRARADAQTRLDQTRPRPKR